MTVSQSTESVGASRRPHGGPRLVEQIAEHGHVGREGPGDPVPEPPGQGRAGAAGGHGHDDRPVPVDGGKLHRPGRGPVGAVDGDCRGGGVGHHGPVHAGCPGGRDHEVVMASLPGLVPAAGDLERADAHGGSGGATQPVDGRHHLGSHDGDLAPRGHQAAGPAGGDRAAPHHQAAAAGHVEDHRIAGSRIGGLRFGRHESGGPGERGWDRRDWRRGRNRRDDGMAG